MRVSAASAARMAAISSATRSSRLSLPCDKISWMVSLSSSTPAMACPTAWSDATGEIVIGAAGDEATVTAEGEADRGFEAIVTGGSPVVADDGIDDVRRRLCNFTRSGTHRSRSSTADNLSLRTNFGLLTLG